MVALPPIIAIMGVAQDFKDNLRDVKKASPLSVLVQLGMRLLVILIVLMGGILEQVVSQGIVLAQSRPAEVA